MRCLLRNGSAQKQILRFSILGAWLVVCLTCVNVRAQSDANANPALDQAFQTLSKLEVGQDLGVFHPIRQAVVAARADETVRTDLEARLIVILEDDSTDLAKDYACRELVTVGSDSAIPALAALLPKERNSYMARYALEGIGSPAVKKTLRDALGTTKGAQQMGVVISLGRLADTEAVQAIAPLLEQENKQLREACLVALGRIGTIPAAKAIQEFAAKAPADLRDSAIDAQLDAVESLCEHDEYKTAVAICEPLLLAESDRVRAAASRALIAAPQSDAAVMIIAFLGSDEPWKRAVAADCVVELNEPKEIATIAKAIADLPSAGQIAAFHSLKHRCDASIREAALRALAASDPEVGVAALAALIRSGTAEDVPELAGLAAGDNHPRVRQAALETLRLMPADGVDAALIDWMARDKSYPLDIVQCAFARRSPAFVPTFIEAARCPDAATRLEAFKALEVLASAEEARALVELLGKSVPGEEREAAGRAVWVSCGQIDDPAQRSAPLLAALVDGNADTQCALLPTLARIGGAEALPAVRKAMKSDNQAVRDAGYRALANWPDAAVADELLEIAESSDVKSYRIWALRAYARVVALPSDRPVQQTFEMLRDAMKLATRQEDKELFVSRLEAVRVPDSLALLVSFLGNTELKEAAVPAVFELAKGLSQSHPEQAAEALRKIQPLAADAALKQQIPKVLRDIEARKK